MGWWASKKFDQRIRMRAHVRGAVNDMITLPEVENVQGHGRQLELRGIKKESMNTTTRVIAKVTLGWNTVYEYEFWVMELCAGFDVVLGTDFMIPAGIRLDLCNTNAKLPSEVMVPLIKAQCWDEDTAEGQHVCGGPTESLHIQARQYSEFRLCGGAGSAKSAKMLDPACHCAQDTDYRRGYSY
ncbi:Eukaryotic/viral aspartic protease [Phytophthora megakarya]|uniref:Eukaryotic/viral aspartic protease n=1 Tax=Phytophthora megakarya TaxID=4795 RepID=A0A225VCI3_9STRA|nr:Eukaryotic/viral aspartic protease [Phytophthora megakarya]